MDSYLTLFLIYQQQNQAMECKVSRIFSSLHILQHTMMCNFLVKWKSWRFSNIFFYFFRFKKENRALAVEKISWLSILLLHQIRLLAYDFGKVKLIFLQVSWSLKINKVEKKIFCYCEFWISHLFHNSAIQHLDLTRTYYK